MENLQLELLEIILFFSGCEKSNLITSTWRKKGKFWSAGRSTFKVSEGAKIRWSIGLTFDTGNSLEGIDNKTIRR